jgi:hypothetical protein
MTPRATRCFLKSAKRPGVRQPFRLRGAPWRRFGATVGLALGRKTKCQRGFRMNLCVPITIGTALVCREQGELKNRPMESNGQWRGRVAGVSFIFQV